MSPGIDGTMTSTRTVQRKRSRGSRLPAEAGTPPGVFCMVNQLGGWQAWKELAARVDAMHRPVTQEELEPGESPQGAEAEPPVRERKQAAFSFDELPGDMGGVQ